MKPKYFGDVYDVNGSFSLWDLNSYAKASIFGRYNTIEKDKKVPKDEKYM